MASQTSAIDHFLGLLMQRQNTSTENLGLSLNFQVNYY